MIYIVSGPSSAGKSTFITSPEARELTGLAANTPVHFSYKLDPAALTRQTDHYLHYGTLRPYFYIPQIRSYTRGAGKDKSLYQRITRHIRDKLRKKPLLEDPMAFWRYDDEPVWSELVSQNIPMHVMILVANKKTILSRIRCRRFNEVPPLFKGISNDYPEKVILKILEMVDITKLYRSWFKELRTNKIPFTVVDSNTRPFKVLSTNNVTAKSRRRKPRLPAAPRVTEQSYPA